MAYLFLFDYFFKLSFNFLDSPSVFRQFFFLNIRIKFINTDTRKIVKLYRIARNKKFYC